MKVWGYRTMTVTNAKCPRRARAWPSKAGLAGLAAGLLAALGGVQAATSPAMAAVITQSAVDPSHQVPGALTITDIDFKRGEDGAGQLILRFSDDGAVPDLHNAGSSVVVDVGNASLPPALARPLDVTDFATPAAGWRCRRRRPRSTRRCAGRGPRRRR